MNELTDKRLSVRYISTLLPQLARRLSSPINHILKYRSITYTGYCGGHLTCGGGGGGGAGGGPLAKFPT